MVYSGTHVKVVDKSGAKSALVIRILRNLEIGYAGRLAVVVIKDAMPKRKKKKEIC